MWSVWSAPDDPLSRIIGASPSGKAADFDSAIRRFESSRPSHAFSQSRDFAACGAEAGVLRAFAGADIADRPQRVSAACFPRAVSNACFPISGIRRGRFGETGSNLSETGSQWHRRDVGTEKGAESPRDGRAAFLLQDAESMPLLGPGPRQIAYQGSDGHVAGPSPCCDRLDH